MKFCCWIRDPRSGIRDLGSGICGTLKNPLKNVAKQTILFSCSPYMQDPDRLRRLLSRPVRPVGWSLSAGPGRLSAGPGRPVQISAYNEARVLTDPQAREESARALRGDLLGFFDLLEIVKKVMTNATIQCRDQIALLRQ